MFSLIIIPNEVFDFIYFKITNCFFSKSLPSFLRLDFNFLCLLGREKKVLPHLAVKYLFSNKTI